MDNSNTSLRSAPVYYREMADRIKKLSGIKHTLNVYETDIAPTWLSHHTSGVPILAYNPKFIEAANAVGKWVSTAIFATEVAFHNNKDLYGKYLCDYYDIKFVESEKKLAVNHFIGRVLRHEGASLAEALETMFLLNRSKADDSLKEKQDLMTKGWEAEDDRLNRLLPVEKPKKKPKQKPGDNISGLNLAVLLLGIIVTLLKE